MTAPASRRRWPRRIAAGGVGVTLALLLVEGALRLAGVTAEPRRLFDPGIFRSDPELRWALVPDYRGVYRNDTELTPTRTNPEGFRGPAWSTRAARRIVALGDSCTFGMGVADEDAYPAQLAALLRARGEDAAVFNLGVMGYDTHQEAALLARALAPLTPEAVVLGWLPNDASDPAAPDPTHVRAGYLVEDDADYAAWVARRERRGLNHSLTYRVLRVRAKQLGTALGASRDTWTSDWLDAPTLAPSLASLSRIHALCAAAGARLVVVLFPRREEVDDPSHDLAHYARVRAHVEALGATVIDLPHAWRQARPPGELYRPRDNTHLAPAGYADVARRVAAVLDPR
ncbi:MAG: GDSL-type esterase/lipase family protein [Planctomycetota bacterium]